MGLLIKQGKHKEDKPIKMDYALAQITALRQAKDKDGMPKEGYMQVGLVLLTQGAYQGKKISDRMPYVDDEPTSFKYKAIRRSAKVPYDKNEPDTIDIEALLLNKAVGVKLTIYEAEDGREFQNVAYVAIQGDGDLAPQNVNAPNDPAPAPSVPQGEGSTPVAPPVVTEDDFPF